VNQVTTVGLDLAKYIFQLHGADRAGAVVFRKKLRRSQLLSFLATLPPCTVAMEACGSAHYWGREIAKLGHTVRLIPPAYVKPFVKRQKNDTADAEAICEAAQRPTMRFVALKSANQQAAAIVFRTRDLLVRQRTQAINALRGHLAEFGVIAAKGPVHTSKLITALEDPASDLPQAVRGILAVLVEELRSLDERIAVLDREIARHAKQDETARRLMTIPGIGAVTAAALTALAPPAHAFRRGRDFAAWLGLTPLQRSSGGKERLGKTSKMGERTLRRLLIIGASAVARVGRAQGGTSGLMAWAHAGPQACDAGAGGAGQQDGPDRLGFAGQGWGLSSSGRGGLGVTTTARLSRGWEGQRRGMAQRSRDGIGKTRM
jgi:transposase